MAHKKAVQKQNALNKLFKPFFSSFTKDKWHSRNPEVRKKAVQELPVSDQETLSNIAMNDSDEAIRAIAANKLSDLDLLQTIIMKGTNGTVKEAAQNRLFQLICGLKHPIPEFDIREKMIRGSRNSALLEFVAANAVEAPLREITIKKISRDPLLGDIALLDTNAHIRQLAAQQIAKRSTLERVTKQSRRKDKRVYKIVKSKLDHIIEDEERPALLAKEVVDICNKLEKLHKRNRLLQEKTTFENFVARWSEIQNFADPETTQRYHTICSNIINSMDQLELELNKEQDAAQNLETLLNRLSNTVDDLLNARENVGSDITNTSEPTSEPTSEASSETAATHLDSKLELIKSIEKVIQSLTSEWHEVIKLITHEDLISIYNAKFQSILDLADTKTAFDPANEKIDNITDSLEKIQTLTEQAENMLDKSGFILEKTISALQYKFQQQIESSFQHTDNQLEGVKAIQQKFESAIQTLKEQSAIQQKNAKKFKQQIAIQADKIKSLISNGLVSKAEKLLREQLKIVDQSDLISNIEKQNFHHELLQIHSQLDDLSSWRNWAHDNERENLAVKAEQLAEQISRSTGLENEYTDVTSQVKEFRKQWKSMHSHTQEDIWQRFNNACNLVYEQCKPFIDKQNETRRDNLKAKQDLCEQLENYIKTMGWPSSSATDNNAEASNTEVNHSIDWIQVDKITKQARKEWSAIGFVERKHHKRINQRFDKDIDIIRDELKKIWHLNHEKFFDLIHKIEALRDTIDDDLSDAINKAKNYQKQWKLIGPVSSYQRNKLWKRFRKGCDFVFNKRQKNIEQKNQLNTERLREKEAICENLEALNKQPLKQQDLQNAFSDIENLWLELVPQAKSLSKEINARYALAVESYQRKINDLLIEQQKQLLEQIIQQADLCTQIESSTDSSEQAVNQFNVRWQALNENNSSDSKLKKRYENALNSIVADKELLIQTELNNKQQYCLKYEILQGKETPPEDQQARMEMQVELLNSNLGQNRTENSNSSQISSLELQLEWYEISNYSQNKQLDERLMNLIAD